MVCGIGKTEFDIVVGAFIAKYLVYFFYYYFVYFFNSTASSYFILVFQIYRDKSNNNNSLTKKIRMTKALTNKKNYNKSSVGLFVVSS